MFFLPSSSPCGAEILNLSLGGGLIALRQPRESEVGESLEVAFTVNQLPFRVKAEVRAVRSDRVLGLRFELSARMQGQLGDLLDELAGSA